MRRDSNRTCAAASRVGAKVAPLLLAGLIAGAARAEEAGPQDASANPDAAPTLRAAAPAAAGDDATPQRWALHAQATFTAQYHPAFTSPYRGTNSLDPAARADETADVTLFAGLRLWKGAEVWINPEIDQGFGLSNTVGVAGFPSGEAYKVGKSSPYLRTQRLFVRQVIDLGGETQKVDPDQNVLGGRQTADHIVITVGKVSVGDIFDNNSYAHDPRNDFMNWTVIDTGTFDYAADSWAYTPGAAFELYKGAWVVRLGLFDLSTKPNSTKWDARFDQMQGIGELERDYAIGGKAGKVRLTGFLTRGRMGAYKAAIALSQATNQPADVALVRNYQSRTGIGLSAEQQLSDDLGVFARAGWADGSKEAYEFTDVDRTVAAGLSWKGKRWKRPDDTIGAAVVDNAASRDLINYLNDGGLGILVGDGRLPHPRDERIVETYYSYAVVKPVRISLDYQFIQNPAYNRDRGPVNVFGARLHTQF
jgi:high affinity Mn2+ porin